MKKVFLGLAVLLVLLVAAAALVPLLFKENIKQALDKQIAKNVNANVIYETDNVSLSMFRSFPNLSLGIDHLTIVGKDSFALDTLAQLPQFNMGIDLMSVLTGDQYKINSINLQDPKIKLVVLKSGKANWDIMVPDTAAAADTAASDFNLAIKGWEINNGTLIYEDYSIPFGMAAYKVNHTGSGDFEKNVFDMVSETTAERFTMTYDKTNYIENATLDADVTMAMDLDKFLFRFKENEVKVNDFVIGFDGSIAMPNEPIDFDMTFKAKETDFKNVLSIVPGMYTEQFKDIKTEGKMAFDGYYKGRMVDSLMPGFGVNLKVNNGYFKYPDLPQAAKNINVDLTVDNPDGITDNMKVDIRKFHTELGKNPIDAKAKIDGLNPMKVDGNLKANIDLAEITKVFPVDGIILRGLLKVDADARGTYSDKQMPVITAALNLANGYVKSKDFPAPIENLNMVTNVENATGNTNDTRIDIKRFNMLLDGEPLEGRVYVQNIDKPIFDANIKGVIDLTKMTKIFPLEGMTLAGRIKGDIATKGKMTDIDAGRYSAITSSGKVNISNLNFVSSDLPQGLKITTADATFNNANINLTNYKGFLGTSDVAVSGTITNYMGYLFSENQDLKGTFTMNSNRFNVNEWMVDENTGQPVAKADQAAPQEATGVVEVPGNLDFVLNAAAGLVLYDNLKLENMKGRVIIKDKVARLEQMAFNTLGGSFVTNGSYNTQSLQHPKFTFGLNIKNLDFQKAFEAFNTIKTIAPIAKFLEGRFSTNFNFAGELGQDMMPVYSSLTGKGLVEVVKAAVSNMKVVNKISEVTQFNELKSFVVENKDIDAEIINGNLIIKPFDIKVGDINMKVGGTNNVSGTIDYVTALDVPTGKVGSALSSKLTSFTGVKDLKSAERVTLNLNIGGTLDDPKVSLSGGAVKAQAKEIVKDVVKSKVEDVKTNLNIRKQQAQDSLRAEAARQRLEAERRAREELEKKRKEAEEKMKKQAGDKLKGILKRP